MPISKTIAIGLLIALLLFPYEATALPSKIQPTYSSHMVIAYASPLTPQSPTSNDCISQVKRYDWNHKVAINVTKAESGANPVRVNNNRRTGDYSVGCFQINILGSLAKNRPSEKDLKNAEVNVAFAYKMWKSQGWKPWSVCKNGKVYCT